MYIAPAKFAKKKVKRKVSRKENKKNLEVRSIRYKRHPDYSLGASQIGAAIGVSTWCSRQEQWRLITGRKKFEGNERTRWGIIHEEMALREYQAVTGFSVGNTLKDQKVMRKAYLRATPDGFTATHILEIKCPYNQKIPQQPTPQYMAQVQLQMYLTNGKYNKAHLFYWTPKNFRVFEIGFDRNYVNEMLELADEFWSYVLDDIEPPRKRKPTLHIYKH